MARLLSVNVGLRATTPWDGETVYTAVWKDASKAGVRYGGSTLTATVKVIWPVTEESSAWFWAAGFESAVFDSRPREKSLNS